MVLKVKMYGKGTRESPMEVPLPTYNHLHGNITQGYAIISIPDDVHGLTAEDLKGETVEQTTEGDHYPSLSDANITKIHAHLGRRYKEHKDKFRVELA